MIIAAVILGLTRDKKSEQVNNSVATNLKVNDASAQSYSASKLPILKDGDKVFGNKKAALKIFVFEDYTNIFSANLADSLEKIKAEMGDKVAIIVRPYYADNSLIARQAAAAVDCAGEQGKWVEMRALMMAHAKNKQALTDNFNDLAAQINLNSGDFATCLTNEQKSGKIEQSVQEAKNYSIQGAPAMFVGDEMILGARPYDNFVDSNGDKIEGLKTVVARKIGK